MPRGGRPRPKRLGLNVVQACSLLGDRRGALTPERRLLIADLTGQISVGTALGGFELGGRGIGRFVTRFGRNIIRRTSGR